MTNKDQTGGFISWHRSLLNHWISDDVYHLKAWTIMVMLVQWDEEPQEVFLHGRVYICYRGQSLKSLETWAELFGKCNDKARRWYKQKVGRFFKQLEECGMICYEVEGKLLRLTILNYDTYQLTRDGNETEKRLKRDSGETQVRLKRDQKNKVNNINKDNKGNKHTPGATANFKEPTIEEITAYCLERKNNVNPQKWLDHYISNGFKVGRNPMKDWKAAVRTWESNSFGSPENNSSPEDDECSDEATARRLKDIHGESNK